MNKGFCEIPIDKLVKADWNYKENNEELAEKLANNIKRNGQIENIIVRELDTGFYEVVNGNHRLDVLKKLGFETIYSFNLGDISEAQAKRIAVETNETKFSSNMESLSALVKELSIEFDDIDLTMPFSEEEINEMLAEVDMDDSGVNEYEEVPEKEIEDVPENNVTKLGDVYELNEHRLVCGDCTSQDVLDVLFGDRKVNLVVTDPPYGINYSAKNKMLNKLQYKNSVSKKCGTRIEREMKNDAIDDYRKFFADFMSIIPFADVNSFYAFITSQNLHNLRLAFDDAKMYFSSILIWLKNQGVISWIDYMFKTEYILYGWKGKHKFYGKNNETNVFEFDKPIKSKLHPTMKPVELIKRLINNSSKVGDIVYDAFLGSGTTIIAAQELGRTCYGTELDEHYCDVIVLRWVNYMKEAGLDYSVKRNGEDVSGEAWLT